MAEIVELLFSLANEIEGGERVRPEEVIDAMRNGAEELETARLDLKAALDLIDDVMAHGDTALWADRAGMWLQEVRP